MDSPEESLRPTPNRSPSINSRTLLLSAGVLLALHMLVQLWLGSGLWTVDEGIYLLQTDWLAQGHWTEAVPDVSFGGTSTNPVTVLPLEHGSVVDGTDWIVYPRHPAYPVSLAAAQRVFGAMGPSLVSVLGSVLASTIIGLSVPKHRSSAFWISALGTSLVFHAHIVWGHSLGIAAAALATLGIVRHIRTGSDVISSLSLVLGLTLAALFRTEGLIFAIAVVIVLASDWLFRGRSPRALVAPASAVGGLVLGAALDTLWRSSVLDGRVTAGSSVNLAAVTPLDRIGILFKFCFDLGGTGIGALGRLGLFICVVLGVWRTKGGHQIPKMALLVPAACGLAAYDSPGQAGLFMAAPLVLYGVLRCERSREAVALAGLAGLTALGVVATMYAPDAGLDFGGRLFAMALPALVILATPAVVKLVSQYGPVGLVVLGLVAVPQAAGILSSVNDSHSVSNDMVEEISEFADSHPDAIFVASDIRTGRVTWELYPTRLVTANELTMAPYLAGHTDDEVWLIVAGSSLEWVGEQVPDGWQPTAEHEGVLVNAIQIVPATGP